MFTVHLHLSVLIETLNFYSRADSVRSILAQYIDDMYTNS